MLAGCAAGLPIPPLSRTAPSTPGAAEPLAHSGAGIDRFAWECQNHLLLGQGRHRLFAVRNEAHAESLAQGFLEREKNGFDRAEVAEGDSAINLYLRIVFATWVTIA
jgi:hypothetical protein